MAENPLASSRQLLLDTNVFIYFLTGREPYLSLLVPLFQRVQRGETSIMVSVVTEAELLVHPEQEGNDLAVRRIEALLGEDGIYVISADRRIVRRAARLRARHNLGLSDAIIVATAIETDCDAVVSNDYAWKRLDEIPFIRLDDLTENEPRRGRGD